MIQTGIFYATVSPAKRPLSEAPLALLLVDHWVCQLVHPGTAGAHSKDALQIDHHQKSLAHLIGKVRKSVGEVFIFEVKVVVLTSGFEGAEFRRSPSSSSSSSSSLSSLRGVRRHHLRFHAYVQARAQLEIS